MKKTSFVKILILIVLCAVLVSCDSNYAKTTKETEYPVDVELVKTSSHTKQLEYFGIISSQILNYSFLMSGRVEAILVAKNQYVKKGTKLIQLETKGLKLALDASSHQLAQAESAFKESENYYKNLKKAFESGGISESDLDKAKLDKDVKEKDYQQAIVNKQSKQDDLERATLVALSDGIVSDIVPKKGELIQAGAEAVIIQGTGQFAEISVAQKDIEKLYLGSKAKITHRKQQTQGAVTYISTLPDLQTFRHTVKVVFTDKIPNIKATIGQTVRVYIDVDKVEGYWLPVKYIFNDGESYVHVVDNNRLRKKRIQIVDYSGDKVRVEGLSENEQLITRGASNINEGYKVRISNI